MEWRPSIRVLGLDLSPVLQQQLPDRRVAVSRGDVELQEIHDIHSQDETESRFVFYFPQNPLLLTRVTPLSSWPFKSAPLSTIARTSASIDASLAPRHSSICSCVMPAWRTQTGSGAASAALRFLAAECRLCLMGFCFYLHTHPVQPWPSPAAQGWRRPHRGHRACYHPHWQPAD